MLPFNKELLFASVSFFPMAQGKAKLQMSLASPKHLLRPSHVSVFKLERGGKKIKTKKTASPALIDYELIHQPGHTKGFKNFPSPIS